MVHKDIRKPELMPNNHFSYKTFSSLAPSFQLTFNWFYFCL